MSSIEVDGPGSAVSAELDGMLARLGELADAATEPGEVSDAERIDRIAALEGMRGVLAAVQHTEMVGFGRGQVEEQAAQVATGALDPAKLGRGIADQIALAAKVSPHVGSRRFSVARVLHADLPRTRALLRAGRISERVAEFVVAQTSHLDADRRRAVDEQIADAGLERQGMREAQATVKKLAYQVDPAGYTARGRTARADRRVTLRPAPDTMSVLTGLLPVEQGVACLAALRRHADTRVAAGDDRTRDQIVADTMVERLTGQATATDVSIEVGIVVPLDALVDPDAPGELVGEGPLPGGILRDVLHTTQGRRSWRRLFAHPVHGTLLDGDRRSRFFDGFLGHLLDLRDHGRCRDPYCGAPIRHRDHIRPRRANGPTSLANGRGTCVRGNQVKEMPGWRTEVTEDGRGERPHTVRTTTPTGHVYDHSAGP